MGSILYSSLSTALSKMKISSTRLYDDLINKSFSSCRFSFVLCLCVLCALCFCAFAFSPRFWCVVSWCVFCSGLLLVGIWGMHQTVHPGLPTIAPGFFFTKDQLVQNSKWPIISCFSITQPLCLTFILYTLLHNTISLRCRAELYLYTLLLSPITLYSLP
jgi:hypothetical protein